jgi:hypothetical protein
MAAGEGGGEVVVALWAICVPIIMMVLALVPPYFFCVGALYAYYGDQALDKWDDVPRVMHTTEQMIVYAINTPNLPMVDFYLPVMGTLVLGVVVTFGLLWWFVRYIRGVFRA